MPNLERYDALIEQAIDLWGEEAQLRQAQEEAGEMIAQINRFLRGREGAAQMLLEECGDVFLTARAVQLIVERMSGEGAIKRIVEDKAQRLHDRIQKARRGEYNVVG